MRLGSPAPATGNENPAQGMGFGRRLSGVPKSLGGTLGWGCRRHARGRLRGYAVHRHAASKGCLLTFRQPLTMQRVRLGRRTDVATWGIPHTRHLADARRCRPTQQPPGTFDRAEPITAASVCSSSRRTGKGNRGEQGRRVSASRTTVLRDGAHVWRPPRAGHPSPHGAGVAAVGG